MYEKAGLSLIPAFLRATKEHSTEEIIE